MNLTTENMSKVMDFYHLQENLEINMVKKLMDSAIKTGKDFAKPASKKVIQKASEARGDLIENKIADKITSIGKPKNKKEKDEINVMEETQEIYIPPENRKQIINDLKLL